MTLSLFSALFRIFIMPSFICRIICGRSTISTTGFVKNSIIRSASTNVLISSRSSLLLWQQQIPRSSSNWLINCNKYSFRCASYRNSHISGLESKPRSYELVHTDAMVSDAVLHLLECREIALDLEFDRDRYAYGFTLCLIQIFSEKGQCYLFDPFTNIDLRPLYQKIFENKNILKVIHAPGEDTRLVQSLGYNLVNIFDTERSAKLLNFQFTSLATVTKELLDIELNKSQQTSNWIKRPLSSGQLEYASLDVRHLIELKNKIVEKAESLDVLEWISEENSALDNIQYTENPAGSYAGKKEQSMLSPADLFVYNTLMKIRDDFARRLNKPAAFVIKKELLLDWTFSYKDENKKKNVVSLTKRKDCHPAVRNRASETLFEEALKSSRIEASKLGLSRSLDSKSSISEKKRVEKIVERVYMPIKELIAKEYGNFTASYIMPVSLMTKLAAQSDQFRVDAVPYTYRRRLLTEFAQRRGPEILGAEVEAGASVLSIQDDEEGPNNSGNGSGTVV